MGVPLRTEPENSDRFAFENAEIGVFVGIDFNSHDMRIVVVLNEWFAWRETSSVGMGWFAES